MLSVSPHPCSGLVPLHQLQLREVAQEGGAVLHPGAAQEKPHARSPPLAPLSRRVQLSHSLGLLVRRPANYECHHQPRRLLMDGRRRKERGERGLVVEEVVKEAEAVAERARFICKPNSALPLSLSYRYLLILSLFTNKKLRFTQRRGRLCSLPCHL